MLSTVVNTPGSPVNEVINRAVVGSDSWKVGFFHAFRPCILPKVPEPPLCALYLPALFM